MTKEQDNCPEEFRDKEDRFFIVNNWPKSLPAALNMLGIGGTWQSDELTVKYNIAWPKCGVPAPGTMITEFRADKDGSRMVDMSTEQGLCNAWWTRRHDNQIFEELVGDVDWWKKCGCGVLLYFFYFPSNLDGADEHLKLRDRIIKLMDKIGSENVWLNAGLVHEYRYGPPGLHTRFMEANEWPVDFVDRDEALTFWKNLVLTSWHKGIIKEHLSDDRDRNRFGPKMPDLSGFDEVTAQHCDAFLNPLNFIRKFFPSDKQHIIEMFCSQLFPVHYLYEWGYDIVGMEFGVFNFSIQVLTAFHRGAVTQFNAEGWMLNELSMDNWLLEDGTHYRTYTVFAYVPHIENSYFLNYSALKPLKNQGFFVWRLFTIFNFISIISSESSESA